MESKCVRMAIKTISILSLDVENDVKMLTTDSYVTGMPISKLDL